MVKSNVVITEYKNKICSLFIRDNQLEDLHVESANSLLSDIYIAKVKNINRNINAAFVELYPGQMAFLPLEDVLECPFIKTADGKLREGDELPVQVIKEGVKTKDPVVTTKFSVTGAYCVITLDKRKGGIQYSQKLSKEQKHCIQSSLDTNDLKTKLSDMGCAAVIRTGAGTLKDTTVLQTELKSLIEKMQEIILRTKTRTCFSCIYKSIPSYIEYLHHLSMEYDEIVTDISEVYELLLSEYKGGRSVRFYNDSFPLKKLYSIETKMDELFSKKVHLKSGANLIIEYTEAMTVVDVNTAKCIAKKDKDTLNYKINIEAAQMLARQLKLRNISGIIIVDFINMENMQYQTELTRELKQLFKNDSVPCNFVDMTALGLVEITRKKISKPIYELL